MPWHARLKLDYRLETDDSAAANPRRRCIARFKHEGPLRILRSLYPEGDGICHNVLVHPPGGLVGGDTLDIDIHAGSGAHGLVTTPGATRFYRSLGEVALQRTRITLGEGARMEWLPLETLCHSGCIAQNHLEMALAPAAELIGWDVTALGLPEAGQPFARGSLLQHFALEDSWLERGRIDAGDARLMDGPLGLAGRRCVATLFLACGTALTRERRELALALARKAVEDHAAAAFPAQVQAGATAPGPKVIVVRVLTPLVEPAIALLRTVRDAWRPALWNLPPTQPRGWMR